MAASNYFAPSYARVIIVISATASAMSDVFDRVSIYARDVWRRFVDEPMTAMLGRAPKLVPVVLERVVARMTAPVLDVEPAFVGAGLAFRRWR